MDDLHIVCREEISADWQEAAKDKQYSQFIVKLKEGYNLSFEETATGLHAQKPYTECHSNYDLEKGTGGDKNCCHGKDQAPQEVQTDIGGSLP